MEKKAFDKNIARTAAKAERAFAFRAHIDQLGGLPEHPFCGDCFVFPRPN
jgi:hypothetical protein